MSHRFRSFVSATVAIALALPAQAFVVPYPTLPPAAPPWLLATPPDGLTLAQSGCEFDCAPEPEPEPAPPTVFGEGSSPGPGAVGLSSRNTDNIVEVIEQVNSTCGSKILRKYRIDCLRVMYLEIAKSLPRRSDYAPIKRALEQAAAKLDRIVRDNRDRTEVRVRPRLGGKPAAPRIPSVRPITEASTARAERAAAAVVQETAAVILRSGEDPTRRTAHYQQIAAAVDSNLVILRSA